MYGIYPWYVFSLCCFQYFPIICHQVNIGSFLLIACKSSRLIIWPVIILFCFPVFTSTNFCIVFNLLKILHFTSLAGHWPNLWLKPQYVHGLSELLPEPLPPFLEYFMVCTAAVVWPWRLKASVWLVRACGFHLGVGTSPGGAQHLAACLCGPWSFGHWPCCRSITSVPLPCSNPSRLCSFCGHCTLLNCSSPAQIFSSGQSRTHHNSLLFAWNDLNQTYTYFFGFYFLAVFFPCTFPWSYYGFAIHPLSIYTYIGTE